MKDLEEYLYLDKEITRKKRSRFYEIKPVILPENESLSGNNGHLGWPVSAKAGKNIIVVFHRNPEHGTGPLKLPHDEFQSSAVVIYSRDNCKTWSNPLDLKTVIKKTTENVKTGFGNSIVTLKDGTVLVSTHYGVFRSPDNGLSWDHIPDSFGEKQLKGPVTNNGPLLIEHPEMGIIAFGHNHNGINENNTVKIADEIWIRKSIDKGISWSEEKYDLPSFVKPVEPSGMIFNGKIIIIARSHGGYDSKTKTWRYVQLIWNEKKSDFDTAQTNITATDIKGHAVCGPWSQDTVDIYYNPVTKRIEVIATNRNGGGQGREHENSRGMSLNQWSIKPDDLLKGSSKYRFDGTLIQRSVLFSFGGDGVHPGASVIDENNIHHIFFYAGVAHATNERKNLSGIFRLSRDSGYSPFPEPYF